MFLEMDLRSIIGIVDHFTTFFAPKLHDNVVFRFATSECRRYLNRPSIGKALPSSTICLSRISDDIYIDDVTSGTKSTTFNYAYMPGGSWYMRNWGSKVESIKSLVRISQIIHSAAVLDIQKDYIAKIQYSIFLIYEGKAGQN